MQAVLEFHSYYRFVFVQGLGQPQRQSVREGADQRGQSELIPPRKRIFMSNEFSLGSVEVALSPPQRFEEFLQSRGKRITQQRRAIVEEVFRQHSHFDAE